jgi:hypothetical protein
MIKDQYVRVKLKIPFDIASNVTEEASNIDGENRENADFYFWNKFPEDLFQLSELCEKINLDMNRINDLVLTIHIDTETKNYPEGSDKNMPLRYRDLRKIIEFIDFIYNQFYVIWI